MTKKITGKCRICGETKKLTKEHVPPKSAFNKGKGSYHPLFDESNMCMSLEEVQKTKGQFYQGGFGAYTLCAKCNNFTGAKYAPEYQRMAIGGIVTLLKNNFKSNDIFHVKIKKCYPLRFFKQIISMFCSINDGIATTNNLTGFLLNEKCNYFDENRIGIFMYVLKSQIARALPIMIKGTATLDSNFTNPFENFIVLSEFGHYPFGFVLVFKEKHNKPEDFLELGADITWFAKCNYDTTCELEIITKVREYHLQYPADYRSKTAVEESARRNKKGGDNDEK